MTYLQSLSIDKYQSQKILGVWKNPFDFLSDCFTITYSYIEPQKR